MKSNKKLLFIIPIVLVTTGIFFSAKIFAEQGVGTPVNSATSKIKEVYDTLDSLGYGSESVGAWGDWGSVWNRIRSAAQWVPQGDVTEGDVVSGKTFYNASRTLKTGTYASVNYTDMSLQVKDFRDSNASTTWVSWTKTNASPEVWKDNRTGLYWSALQGSTNAYTNNFTISTCDFFTTIPRGNYNGSDSDCGDSINLCGNLSLDGNGDSVADAKWYLPTQAELITAYLDGIYLSTNAAWATGNNYWSSTEYQSINSSAWFTYLNDGYTNNNPKTNPYSVRCVLRDVN